MSKARPEVLVEIFVLALCSQVIHGAQDGASIQLLARLTFPEIRSIAARREGAQNAGYVPSLDDETYSSERPLNQPREPTYDYKKSYADEKWERLQEYYAILNGRLKDPHSPVERREILEKAMRRLFAFIEAHIKDLKRLLWETDRAIMAMALLKMKKKMESAETKIRNSQARIPFGIYASPEFKCLGTSYYIVSAHNQEDAQMILSSERRPHCYAFRGAFAFSAFYHRHSEAMYIGPHSEHFDTNENPSQGLYCKPADDNWSDAQCVYKVNPREEFPESVEYEPKVSYWCGPYRYFIPTTTDIRCIFSVFSMNFILRFAYDGVTYKSQDLSFMYQNGQVFYTDEPWAGMSCWNWACKWRHNQNQRSNEFFVN